LARLNYAVTPEIEGIVRKALEKNPDLRYQTARDLYNDLMRVRTAIEETERHGSGARRGSGAVVSSSGQMMAAVAPENSIAVITFANITREPSDEWIGSGIAETVSN